MGRKIRTAIWLAVLAALVPATAHAGVRAGVGEVDGSWHVGASAGQYAGSAGDSHAPFNPTAESITKSPSYGRQSALKIRAIVVEGPDGKRVALVKHDLYLTQDGLHRRTAQLLEQGRSGITRQSLALAATHDHSSPYYSSPSWGVWTFQDVFDIRFYDYYSRRIAEAVEQAAARLVPVRVGGAVGGFDKTHRNSMGPGIADDGTPSGFPHSETDKDLTVVRFDDISDPARPKPLANIVNWHGHPEMLEGNDLISADYIAPLQRMSDRATGALTIFTQGSVGTAEPERSAFHSLHERLEFTHRQYGQAEFAARLLSDRIVGLWRGVGSGSGGDPARFVAFSSDFPVGMIDHWYPGPFSHPLPTVSNCRTDTLLGLEPVLPLIGLPDCSNPLEILGLPETPLEGVNPGINTDALEALGIPVPENYGVPSYTALEEDINVHLQAFRLGDILFTICSCEQWSDQGRNIKTRTDRRAGNEWLGYDWKQKCIRDAGGSWTCRDPRDETKKLPPLSEAKVARMHAQVTNPANGWNNLENVLGAESEPVDPAQVKGNFTHDDDARSAALGYKLTVTVSQANDYNGYIATYREYQRGDHYRKALTAWGPHSADYMATRLVTLGRLLKDPGMPLPTDQRQEQVLAPKVVADNLINDLKTAALGGTGRSLVDAYERLIPDDGGRAQVVTEPKDIDRFNAALFTWNGGSNFTDNPDVRVERLVRGAWQEYADGSGEVPVTLKFPQPGDIPSYLGADQPWHWTAHFEAFVAPFELGDRPRATPRGRYRFTVRGQRKEGGAVRPYSVTSREFEVREWPGITVGDARMNRRTRRAGFRIGPRTQHAIKAEGRQPALRDEIGPIDFPDSYRSPARFVREARTAIRDEDAPADPGRLEWYCFDCSFRPWADSADAKAVAVELVATDGSRRRVAARRKAGRWVASEAVPRGGYAFVPPGCARDAWGDLNGAGSKVIGRGKVKGRCASAKPRVVRCSPARGRLAGRRLGVVALGRSRAATRAALPARESSKGNTDRFCLRDKGRVRVLYSGGKAVVAVTTSRRYRALGRKAGARRRGLGRGLKAGKATWVVRSGRSAALVFRISRGRVAEIGIAQPGSPRVTAKLLRRLR